jgi:curved DNA-binding protein CbpA
MKHFAELNYYELLELQPNANRVQIQKAYELARKTFGEDSMAAYSIFDAATRKQILERVEEAFTVLLDEERRYQYDLKLGFREPSKMPPPVTPFQTAHPNPTGGDRIEICPPPALGGQAADPVQPTPQSGDLYEEREINGKLLREFREQRGIPLQEIAAKTRINITYLQFIEQDHYKGLPTEVYLRSYLVQYAKIMGLDPNRVADGFLQVYRNWKKSQKSH